MKKPVNLAILGVSGRMGQMLYKAAEEYSEVNLVAASEKLGHEWIGQDLGRLMVGKPSGIKVSDQPTDVFAISDAVIDFTTPEASIAHAALSAQARIVHVIGTTGFDSDHIEKLNLASMHARLIRAGNMSLGVNLLTQLTQQVAAALDESYDIEIVEMHHNKKVDSPSGTALMLGKAAAAGRNDTLEKLASYQRHGYTGARKKGSIGFASSRGGDVVGEHDVIFSAFGERLILRHIATDRMIFSRGAIKAAIWGVDKEPGHYDMLDVLGLNK
ncbi:MAG: 4-hydroxy-tetrahydrodipicolinate reductase [Pseudomonadota bacterium]|nr:4-hydroxy-tetrahydrodipicolinate reductase [Pseudomonadota bacterium]